MLSGQLDAIAVLAVIFLPEEDGVDDGPRYAPRRAVLKTLRPRRDGFVRHAEAFIFGPDKRIDGLINGN